MGTTEQPREVPLMVTEGELHWIIAASMFWFMNRTQDDGTDKTVVHVGAKAAFALDTMHPDKPSIMTQLQQQFGKTRGPEGGN